MRQVIQISQAIDDRRLYTHWLWVSAALKGVSPVRLTGQLPCLSKLSVVGLGAPWIEELYSMVV